MSFRLEGTGTRRRSSSVQMVRSVLHGKALGVKPIEEMSRIQNTLFVGRACGFVSGVQHTASDATV